MTKRIEVDSLPEFNAADYLDSEEAIEAYLADIQTANSPALMAAALADVAEARRRLAIATQGSVTKPAP